MEIKKFFGVNERGWGDGCMEVNVVERKKCREMQANVVERKKCREMLLFDRFMAVKKLNQGGQASITDALFFLVIVSGLSSLLYLFSIGYGLSVLEATASEYRSDFAISALKTILYSSTPRNPEIPLDESTEVDYLLAAVKEDYADDKEIDESRNVLRDSIVGIMEPFADNFDYMFYIYIPDKREFPLLMLYLSRWAVQRVPGDSRRIEVIDPKEDFVFFCSPDSLDTVDVFQTTLGTVYPSNSRLQLLEIKQGARGYNTLLSQVHFSMWNSTSIPQNVFDTFRCTCSAKKAGSEGTFRWQGC